MRGQRRQWSTWLIISALLMRASSAWAAQPQIAVITALDGPQMTLDQNTVRNVYLKKIFVDGKGQRLTPVNFPSRAPMRVAFSRALLHMDDTQLQDYWDQQYFQGVSPPYVLASADAVVRFVATTPGAIGYVEPCQADASVRIVLTITLPAHQADDLPACPEHPAP
jgi:ABC-type phosphate transport system substrate-binding protein